MTTQTLTAGPTPSLFLGQDGLSSTARRHVDSLELASARRALGLLRRRLTPAQMVKLLEPELAASDRRWREWARASNGVWKPCFVDITVKDLTKAEFLSWWSTALDDLDGIMYPAFPEHYLFEWQAGPDGDRRLLVVEELGHLPFRMFCSYGPEWAPAKPLRGFELISVGVGRLADGTEVTRFMSQVRQSDRRLRFRAGMYLVAAAPEEVVRAHQEQLLVEWTRWIEMARDRASLAADVHS